MRLSSILILIISMVSSVLTATAAEQTKTALVIHGGAGVITRDKLSEKDEQALRKDLDRALDAGNAILKRGGSALDAIQAAIVILEDSPWFNAGKGAVFNAQGKHELDAAIMDGSTLAAGSVAGVTTIRHPILLARAVMEQSPHVMLAGAGAEAFADTRKDIERVTNDWFDTPLRRKQLEEAKAKEIVQEKTAAQGRSIMAASDYFGTVGAVALDQQGRIAAGTSTGGMTNKRWSRIGDSPLIGAGTYASSHCGVSGTGWGEFYIRTVAAHAICARVELRGDPLALAAEDVINKQIPALGGDGGAIALDSYGNIAMLFNTPGMYRGWIKPDGSRGTAVFSD